MTTTDVAPKNFLTSGEMAKFLVAARAGKHGVRDYLLGLMAYRHGLRVSELIRIRLDDLDLDAGRIFVRRAKGSMSTNHPMQGDEVRAVRAWLRERKRFLPLSGASLRLQASGDPSHGHKTCASSDYSRSLDDTNGDAPSAQNSLGSNGEATRRQKLWGLDAASSPFLFLNEKHRVFARQAINYLFAEIGKRAGLAHVHPHMLRHGCGYALANKGCDTRLIQDYLGHKDIHNTERYTRTNAARFERLWE